MSRRCLSALGVIALLLVALLSAAAARPVHAQTGEGTGWLGSYYGWVDDNLDCTSAPAPSAWRVDADVNFYWPEYSSPIAGVGNANYTICWTRYVNFPTSANYTVTTLNDDGMNVWVDNQIMMNAWYDQGPSWHTGTLYLSAGRHAVTIKYYNRTLGGVACVAFAPEGQNPPWRCPYTGASPVAQAPYFYPYTQPQYLYYQPPAYFPPTQPPVYDPYNVPYYVPQVQPPAPYYPAPAYGCQYQVRRGDTLSMIAWRYHTTTWALAQWNGIRNPNLIYSGMWLRIPNCR